MSAGDLPPVPLEVKSDGELRYSSVPRAALRRSAVRVPKVPEASMMSNAALSLSIRSNLYAAAR